MIFENRVMRHEMKYIISDAQEAVIRTRLKGVISPDRHAGAAGSYNIRSLYFDDCFDRCFHENENGCDPREKFRLRIYDHSSDAIFLECKRKEHGMTSKTSCPLTFEQAQILMHGGFPTDTDTENTAANKLKIEVMSRMMRPVVIVEYERIPYVCTFGNVRITIDTAISSSSDTSHFFSEHIHRRPILPTGMKILEVKYDNYMPEYISDVLHLENLRQTAFSKYYLSRCASAK